MKQIMRSTVSICIAVFVLISAISCGNKSPDMGKLTPELEALGATVDGDMVILSHDSQEEQQAQWLFLEESFAKTEHIQIQVTGKVHLHTVVAMHREYSYFYLCAVISEEAQGIPVAISGSLAKEFINTQFPEDMFIPEGITVRVTGTLEMYKEFMGKKTWKSPVLVLTSIEYIQNSEIV